MCDDPHYIAKNLVLFFITYQFEIVPGIYFRKKKRVPGIGLLQNLTASTFSTSTFSSAIKGVFFLSHSPFWLS